MLIPYVRSAKDTDPKNSWLRQRVLKRFVHVAGKGVRRLSREEALRIAELNMRMGQVLNQNLVRGFEGLQKGQAEIHHALIDQSEIIQTGFDNVEFALHKGFEMARDGLEDVAHSVDQVGELVLKTGDQLDKGLTGIKASVDMGMMNIVSQFELQREEMQQGLGRLAHLLENQHKTRAKERYEDGKGAYEHYLRHPDEPQFLDDAQDYLLQSLEAYRGNPFCHLYLGHLYQEASSHYDLDKSLQHYQHCATYAKGLEHRSLAALGYFMAAWIAYVSGNAEEASHLGQLSLEYDPDGLPEAWYNLAKYHAHLAQPEPALERLDVAVRRFDPLYSIKADIDPDFEHIQKPLENYFERIRKEEAQALRDKLHRFGI